VYGVQMTEEILRELREAATEWFFYGTVKRVW